MKKYLGYFSIGIVILAIMGILIIWRNDTFRKATQIEAYKHCVKEVNDITSSEAEESYVYVSDHGFVNIEGNEMYEMVVTVRYMDDTYDYITIHYDYNVVSGNVYLNDWTLTH